MAVEDSRRKQRTDAQYLDAVKNFEAGVRLFQKQSYDKALEFFEKLASGAPPEVGNRARAYLRMCEQKLKPPELTPKGPREYYDLGIAQLNARNLDAALEYLTKAQKAAMDQEHVHYALAATCALQGNADAAIEHLAVAIQLRPRNRFLAAKDADFDSLAGDPRFRQLVFSGMA
jgi:tetratricopeptide (TPR) repeat protein